MTSAVILAGGLGTRLRSVVPDLPKPMANIGGRPFLEYLMDYWIEQGVSQFILSVGYKKKLIIDYFGSSYKRVPVVYAEESEPLGTGGALVLAAQGLKEPFLLLNGDTYFEVSFDELKDFHQKSGSICTIALFRATEANRYGTIIKDHLGRVQQIKTAKSQIGELANGGVYLVDPIGLDPLKFSPGDKYSLEDEILNNLINSGSMVMGIEQGSVFLDIGIPADYSSAEKIIRKESK